jgi:hypothetical protein
MARDLPISLKIQTACSSEILLNFYQCTGRHNPEDSIDGHIRANVKFASIIVVVVVVVVVVVIVIVVVVVVVVAAAVVVVVLLVVIVIVVVVVLLLVVFVL